MRARIRFAKTGNMKYVGHLDLMRFFQRAMRRADIPIRYSEGFSPHQIMSFAAPLGIGLESTGEYVDITLDDTLLGDTEAIRSDEKRRTGLEDEYLRRLSEVMCPGVEVMRLRFIPDESGKAMSCVASAGYRVEFAEEPRRRCKPESEMEDTRVDIRKAVRGFMDRSSVVMSTIVKKSGVQKDRDIRPLVYEMTADESSIDMHISQGSVENLKPELVLEAMGIDAHGARIIRTEMYDHEGLPLIR